MKHCIVQEDKKTVGKVLKGIELANRKDDKITLIKLKFSVNGYYNLTAIEIDKLSETAQDFFHPIYCFGKNEKNNKLCQCLDARRSLAKKTKFVICGLFQIYFYENFFSPTVTVKSTTTKN